MDVVAVGESAFGGPVWAARDLAEADGVIVVNRVKPHTDFHGDIESGLVKMLVIGAGKHAGALAAHGHTVRHGFPAVLRDHGERLLAGLPVLCGIALVEDQHERTALLEVLRPEDFFAREHAAARARASTCSPGCPFDQLDVLVVDELGKDVSGAGHGHQRHRPRVVLGRRREAGAAAHHQDLRARPHCRHPRQRLRHRHGRLHHGALRRGDRPRDHRRQLHHVQLPRGRAHPHRLRRRPRGDRRRHADRRRQRPEGGAARLGTRHGHLERIAVSEALLDEVRAGEALRPAGPLFPLPYDENGDLRSPFS